MRILPLAVALVLAGAMVAPATECASGRWIFADWSFLTPFAASRVALGRDVITVDGRWDSEIENVCYRGRTRVKQRKNGDIRVRIKWRDCVFPGRVKFRGVISDTACRSLHGVLTAKRVGIKREPVWFTKGRCGDTRIDPGGGEACDYRALFPDRECRDGKRCSLSCRCE